MREISVDDEIKMRGYKGIDEPFLASDELVDLLLHLRCLEKNRRMNMIAKMTKKDAILDGKIFMKQFYHLHDVPFIKERSLYSFWPTKKIKMVSPLDLPVEFEEVEDELCFGGIITFVRDDLVAFTKIVLNSIISELTSCSYVHELTHSLVDSIRGVVGEYYNAEIISIYNELVIASSLDSDEHILRALDSRRIFEISTLCLELQDYRFRGEGMKRDDILLNGRYIISDIKAYNLFAECYYGSMALRKYFRQKVDDIMNGETSVEELVGEFMDDEPAKLTLSPKTLKYFQR